MSQKDKKDNCDLHIHITNFSPVLNKGVENLIKKGIFKTKTELTRAGILHVLHLHCPNIIADECTKQTAEAL